MITAWTTVISWQQGKALLHCKTSLDCAGCHSAGAGCNGKIFCVSGGIRGQQLQIAAAQPLEPGIPVKIGFSEARLLYFALLVYLAPLAGFIVGGGLFQWLCFSEYFIGAGAVTGGIAGFFVARIIAAKLAERPGWKAVILQVGLPSAATGTT